MCWYVVVDFDCCGVWLVVVGLGCVVVVLWFGVVVGFVFVCLVWVCMVCMWVVVCVCVCGVCVCVLCVCVCCVCVCVWGGCVCMWRCGASLLSGLCSVFDCRLFMLYLYMSVFLILNYILLHNSLIILSRSLLYVCVTATSLLRSLT